MAKLWLTAQSHQLKAQEKPGLKAVNQAAMNKFWKGGDSVQRCITGKWFGLSL